MRDMAFAARAARWMVIVLLPAALAACGDSGKDEAGKGEEGKSEPVTEGRPPVASEQLLPPVEEAPDPDEVPAGRLPQTVRPTSYNLDLRILPGNAAFSGQVQISTVFAEDRDAIWLHGKDIEVKSAVAVLADGREVAATYEQVHPTGVARVAFADTVPAGEILLHFEYEAPFNERLAGLYRVQEGGEWYAVTQFEAIDARRVFPGFDEPAFKVPFDISVTARADHVVITTTPQISEEEVVSGEEPGGGLVKRTFATTEPLPTYLLAFAVGPYDLVTADPIPPLDGVRDRPVPLRAVAARGKGEKLEYALEHTAGILGALERYFGTEYPYRKLDIIAAPQFAFGAMENVGAIIYTERLILLNEDAPLKQRRAYALVHAHELAHQWFGNLVTPEWWSDIWLNEAFATWMGNKAAHDWNPDGEYGRQTLRRALRSAMPVDSLSTAREIRQPVRRNQDIMNSFDSITYRKGGAVLSMFESYLGEEAFRDGVRLHMKRYAHGVANTEQFMESLADGSGDPDVVPAFSSFIDQPGVPLVSAKADCTGGKARVALVQGPYRPLGSDIAADRRWKIPACIRAVGADGTGEKICTLIEGDQATADLKGACPKAIVPNADGAAYYRFALDPAGWQALTENLDTLNAKEALSFADSLMAALNAGEIETADFFEGLRAVAQHEAWDAATFPIARLVELGDTILDAEHRKKLHEFGAQLYKPRLDEIGLIPQEGEAPSTRLLRVPVAEYLALHARDEGLRERLSYMGQDYAGYEDGGEINPEAAPPDLRPLALTVAAQEVGRPFTESLAHVLAESGDAELRTAVADAFAQVEDPAMAADIRAFTLGDTMRLREIRTVIEGQLKLPEVRGEAWNWFRTNFDALMEKLPPWRRSSAPDMVKHGFCSDRRLREVREFFTEKAESLPGSELSFNQTLETIELCVALKGAKGAEIENWLDERF
ncbi:MAG: M1 family metallopeptidase [Alphaproteobacteria bacterium]